MILTIRKQRSMVRDMRCQICQNAFNPEMVEFHRIRVDGKRPRVCAPCFRAYEDRPERIYSMSATRLLKSLNPEATLRRVSDDSGYSYNYVYKIFAGMRSPTLRQASDIARALKIPLDQLNRALQMATSKPIDKLARTI